MKLEKINEMKKELIKLAPSVGLFESTVESILEHYSFSGYALEQILNFIKLYFDESER